MLDAFTRADAGAHLAGEDDEHARRFGWFPRRSTPATVRRAIERWEVEWRRAGSVRAFAVRDASSGALVGGCELRVRGDGVAELAYWVFPERRGRGIASRAASLATDFAFADLGVSRVELTVEPDNDASRAVARNAGFAEVGRTTEETAAGERRTMLVYARDRSA